LENDPGPAKKKVRSFEDLFVFQEAFVLTNDIYRITREGPLAKDYALADQMRRSAISIVSHIAEGFERETAAEFIRPLFVAKGSCGELRAQLMSPAPKSLFRRLGATN
jgi:four helix bundle protein